MFIKYYVPKLFDEILKNALCGSLLKLRSKRCSIIPYDVILHSSKGVVRLR